MKKISLLLLFSCMVGIGWARLGPYLKTYFMKNHQGEDLTVNGGFLPASFPTVIHPFVVVIIGQNNGAFVKKTLASALAQKYDSFRVVYVDDASTDGSFELARDLIYGNPSAAQITLARNEKILGSIANLSRVAQECAEEEILVILQGEDLLAHDWVLTRLNQYYADPDLWLTYGQYLEYPSFRPGSSRPYSTSELGEKGFRGAPFVASHLKTFYASLFKKIPEDDLLYHGQYIAQGECAYMMPLLEMAQNHFQFIPEILYLSTGAKRQNDPSLQTEIEQHVRNQAAQAPLVALFAPPIDTEDPS